MRIRYLLIDEKKSRKKRQNSRFYQLFKTFLMLINPLKLWINYCWVTVKICILARLENNIILIVNTYV